MYKIILQPAGSIPAQKNYNRTIENPVDLHEIEHFIDEVSFQELSKVFENGQTRFWGVMANNEAKWEKLESGDIVLFTGHSRIFASAIVRFKMHNKELALEYWKEDDEGNTWEYLYFVDEVLDQNISYLEFNEAAGYSPKYNIYSFTVLDDEKSKSILNAFDSLKYGTLPTINRKESVKGNLKDYLIEVLSKYPKIKTTDFPGSDLSMRTLVETDLPQIVSNRINNFDKLNLKFLGSIGKGQWAKVPWVAILNTRLTVTVSEGIYVVYLFCSDGSGVYLTLNQGTGGIGSASTDITHDKNRDKIINSIQDREISFKKGMLDERALKGGSAPRPRAYERACILWKYYSVPDLIEMHDDNKLKSHLNEIMEIYSNVKKANNGEYYYSDQNSDIKYWIFQGNPNYYDVRGSLIILKEQKWSVRQHKNDVKTGDNVFVWEAGPNASILAKGTILCDPEEMPEDEIAKQFIVSKDAFKDLETRVVVQIEKVLDDPITKDILMKHPILKDLTILRAPQGTNFPLTIEQAGAIIKLIEGDMTRKTDKVDKYTKAEALKDLFLEESSFDYIMNRLRAKKNIILQGPPGVGKTFIAKRLAYYLMGCKDDNRVSMIQFHQSYSYEDFMQGFRPNEDGKFILKNGAFYEFCTTAVSDEERPFVFIIDEINRGNLSKIFGEVMMMIEADKRGPEFSLPLTYGKNSSDKFYIPKNVHMIGTMNTADRSLAMVDYALRRRFSFIDLEPQFKSSKFRQLLIDNGIQENLAIIIIDRMTSLNETIAEDTKNLGPGYCVGHSYFCPTENEQSYDEQWFRMVIKSEIEPLLREYWFDDPKRAADNVGKLLSGISE